MGTYRFFAPVLFFFIFSVLSYFVLKHVGVKQNLFKRAAVFGGVFLSVHVGFTILFQSFGIMALDKVAGFLATYLYVNKVLDVDTGKKLAIVFCLPLAAVCVGVPILFFIFKYT